MRSHHYFLPAIAALGVSLCLVTGGHAADPPQVRATILRLADDHFATRQRAAQSLLLWSRSPADADSVEAGLRAALDDPDAELRLHSRNTLSRILHDREWTLLRSITDPGIATDQIDSEGLRVLVGLIGDSHRTRDTFATVARSHPMLLRDRSRIAAATSDVMRSLPATNRNRRSTADHDWIAWVIVDSIRPAGTTPTTTCSDGGRCGAGSNALTAMLIRSLGHPAQGPRSLPWTDPTLPREHGVTDADLDVMRRLIWAWARTRQFEMSDVDRMSIWLRCGRTDQAIALARSVATERRSSPAARSVAIAVLGRLDPSDVSGSIAGCCDDDRLVHAGPLEPSGVWLSTTVADVAWAWRIRLCGGDPRSLGHHHLQADRRWVLSPASLGFTTVEGRTAARDAAVRWINADR